MSDLEFHKERTKKDAAKKLDNQRRRESAATQRDELRDEKRYERKR